MPKLVGIQWIEKRVERVRPDRIQHHMNLDEVHEVHGVHGGGQVLRRRKAPDRFDLCIISEYSALLICGVPKAKKDAFVTESRSK
jgi:hypothetical protein